MLCVLKSGGEIVAVFNRNNISAIAYDGERIYVNGGNLKMEAPVTKKEFLHFVHQVIQ